MREIQKGFYATDDSITEIVSDTEVIITEGTAWIELPGGKLIVRGNARGFAYVKDTTVVLETAEATGYATIGTLVKYKPTSSKAPKENKSATTGCLMTPEKRRLIEKALER